MNISDDVLLGNIIWSKFSNMMIYNNVMIRGERIMMKWNKYKGRNRIYWEYSIKLIFVLVKFSNNIKYIL